MIIHIDKETNTDEIKKKFHRYFPYLKLGFYKKPHKEGEGNPSCDLINGSVPIKDISPKVQDKNFIITPDNTVSDIEQRFEKLFGIHAQVFRKSKSLWLETTATDNWTLREQNETGKEMET